MEEAKFTIQQVADQTGLSVHTLRYYERIGLISQVDRASNGHRRYSEYDVGWIGFLMKLRATGMPIAKMQQYAGLQRQGEATRYERLALLKAHRDEVRQRIEELSRHLAVIESKISHYSQVIEASPPGQNVDECVDSPEMLKKAA